MRHSRRTALAFLWLSASLAQAQPFPEKDLPPKLKAWVRWALDDAPAYGCALAGEAAVCLWPGRLQLDLSAAGGRFAQDAHADRASDLGLPGDAQRWPQDVRLDGAPAPVVDKDGVPSLRLPPGAHKVDGRFQWRQLPDSLPVPQPTAIVDLTLDGRRVPLPQREENGLLWIRKGGERETAAGDSLRLQVFRKLRDGIPLFLETSLRLEVSGKAREIELEGALVESAAAVAVRGDLPAQVEPNGRLRVQVRAGLFSVSLLARLEGAPKSVAAPRAPEPWPGSEIWVFEPDELLRQVQASGGNPVEPSRTDLPEDWRRFSAFGLEAGGALTLTELRRGEPEAPPDKLALQRELWLDLDGGAFTVRDRLTGTLSRTWRLDLLPPGQLGRAAVGGQDQLVTAGPELSSTGVELRAGTLDLTADSRLPRGGALPAVGWSANVESLGAQLHLPPGWRLIGGSGVDRLPHSWIGRWTLLGFFFVLLVAFGVGRLFGWRQGVVALLAVGLSYHERGAPFLSWLSLLGAVALLRAAPEGRLGKFARAWRALSLIVMAFVLLPFLRDQVREAIYPQVGRGTDVARDAGVLMDQVGGEVNAPPPPAPAAS
jgi:hypothetical protein